jgi:hypothetical protein
LVLIDLTGGLGFGFGALWPSANATSVSTQLPSAVDGGTPVGIVYPANISFSGIHTHTGTIDTSGGALLVGDIAIADTEATPTIAQAQQAGSAGAAGYHLAITAQPGQDGGATGGDGGDIELGLGLPGNGGTDGVRGRLVKQWGNVSGYQWKQYEWCSGEAAYNNSTSYPLTANIADGEIHFVDIRVLARDVAGGTTTKTSLIRNVFQRNGATVTEAAGGETVEYTAGTATIVISMEVNNPDEWRIGVVDAGSTGDVVIFATWVVAALDGA